MSRKRSVKPKEPGEPQRAASPQGRAEGRRGPPASLSRAPQPRTCAWWAGASVACRVPSCRSWTRAHPRPRRRRSPRPRGHFGIAAAAGAPPIMTGGGPPSGARISSTAGGAIPIRCWSFGSCRLCCGGRAGFSSRAAGPLCHRDTLDWAQHGHAKTEVGGLRAIRPIAVPKSLFPFLFPFSLSPICSTILFSTCSTIPSSTHSIIHSTYYHPLHLHQN